MSVSIFDGHPDVLAPWELWVRATALSQFVLREGNAWPVLETLHYFGLSLLLGSVGLFDLRVLGVAKAIPPAALHRMVPFGVAGFLLNLLTGMAFFSGFPEQYAYNMAFRVKLVLLGLAGLNVLLFYSTAFGAVRTMKPGEDAPFWPKLLCGLSLGFWLGVLVCGRLLTFFRPPFFH
jgi:hypothetical protein